MWNEGWPHLDNRLEGIFPSKSLILTMRKDIESLVVAMQVNDSLGQVIIASHTVLIQICFSKLVT